MRLVPARSFKPLVGSLRVDLLALLYSWDVEAFRALNLVTTNPVLDVLMVGLTSLALPYVLPLLTIPLWWSGRREAAFDLLVLLVLVVVVTEILKYAFDRARPCDVLPNVRLLYPGACAAEGDPAFPSGHTSRIFAAAALVSLGAGWRVKVPATVIAIGVGVSRVYLGVHWPMDVLGGAILGATLALLFVAVAARWTTYQRIRQTILAGVTRRFSRSKAR